MQDLKFYCSRIKCICKHYDKFIVFDNKNTSLPFGSSPKVLEGCAALASVSMTWPSSKLNLAFLCLCLQSQATSDKLC